MSYFFQAGMGQMELWNKAHPLEEVQDNPRVSSRIKRLLAQVENFKAYGETRGLKATTNYTDYVKLDRDAVVWVVSACKPLAFEPKRWSFPIVGSFTYLGWFDREDAKEYGEELKKEGWDVDVRGASAYSTLGWFRDPILSTMIRKGEGAYGDLANTILHESVHATIYVNGQSYFNESLASFVADAMMLDYVKVDQEMSEGERQAYLKAETRRTQVGGKFKEAYAKLEALYKGGESDEAKTSKKKAILAKLKKDTGWRREITNASLIQYRTYGVGMEDFEKTFRRCGKDWGRFLKGMGSLKEESFPEKQMEDFGAVLAGAPC